LDRAFAHYFARLPQKWNMSFISTTDLTKEQTLKRALGMLKR
jgi:hypothetical protein